MIPQKIRCVIIALFVPFISFSQSEPDTTKHWKAGGNTALTFSQVSLTNWSAGGKNSVSGTFKFNTFLNYKRGKNAWENTLDVGYGLTQQGEENIVKTDDRIQFVSKYGHQASKKWYYTALTDFKTQIDLGYKNPPDNEIMTSKFMSPAYLLLSLGMDYKPNDNFSLYLSPLTSKMTFVNDEGLSNQGAYGVEPGENMRSEFGASLKSIFKKENVIENVDFKTRLDLFSNLGSNPENVDIEWETQFDFKVNSFLSANLGTTLLYDDDIKYVDSQGVEHGARIQFKQLFGFGINYKF
ncbi:DUF3078 domain-containing protein [Marinilabilia rubra]|uniref:DUF3078 domain-containing protein n=1 Tax=Marinilabilia rubra TaxID=2162893 RepID=A0A2U2BAQ7_9BACT|nr:DUF3078 domain-containing protein [Marinilabilia rubra]PWE00154.1 hypothetical protein DDZ16_07320 [Marinilabilia rubra]